jgi:hypothetical protein
VRCEVVGDVSLVGVSVLLTEIYVRQDTGDGLQSPEIFFSVLVLIGEGGGEAIYGQDNHLG